MPLPNVSSGDPHVSAHNAERDGINTNATAILTKISKPANPKVGDLLRWDGNNWVSSLTRLFEGQGSPEGVVAAPIGSRYVDTAAAAGAIEWIKRTGVATSNTGWMLSAFADTGLRNISADVLKRNSGLVYTALLRRSNDVVDLYLDVTTPTGGDTNAWTLLSLPSGFRPPSIRYGALQDNKELASNGTSIASNGDVNLLKITTSKRDRYTGVWLTTDPWPAVLPGVSA